MTDDEIVADGGVLSPLYPFNKVPMIGSVLLGDSLPRFTALRGIEAPLTEKQLKKIRKRDKRERKRRAKQITVTMTVGEWEDLLEAARWG